MTAQPNMDERGQMVRKLFKTFATLAAIAVITGVSLPANTAAAAELELVLGTGDVKGKLFAAGSAISMASVMQGKGIKVYNYGTKGGKDNIKRIAKKKRAINFALVTAKDLSKAKANQIKEVSGLMALGKANGQSVLLIVRNKAPKKVSKDDYAAAVAEFVRVLKSGKTAQMIKKQWSGFAPSSGAADFKAVGVKLHKAAIM
jgi:phosphotransferase system IIB component